MIPSAGVKIPPLSWVFDYKDKFHTLNSTNMSKIKFPLWTPWRFLGNSNLGTRWWWWASSTSCFTLRERAPGTHYLGAWMDPTAGIDVLANRRNLLLPARNRTTIPRSSSLYSSHYTECAIPDHSPRNGRSNLGGWGGWVLCFHSSG